MINRSTLHPIEAVPGTDADKGGQGGTCCAAVEKRGLGGCCRGWSPDRSPDSLVSVCAPGLTRLGGTEESEQDVGVRRASAEVRLCGEDSRSCSMRLAPGPLPPLSRCPLAHVASDKWLKPRRHGSELPERRTFWKALLRLLSRCVSPAHWRYCRATHSDPLRWGRGAPLGRGRSH